MSAKTATQLGREYGELMISEGLSQPVNIDDMVGLGLGAIPDMYEPAKADGASMREFWASYNEVQACCPISTFTPT